MSRVYLQRAASGYRAARGEVVRRVQLALKDAGSDPREIDGIYGRDTEAAIKEYQDKRNIDADGRLNDVTWTDLMEEGPPSIRDRCLQLTGDFEGHGFQRIAGNFDGAGLTWGIIGFTLKHGEIQQILREVQKDHPALLDEAFANLKDELFEILGKSWSEQLEWANSISIPPHKYRVDPVWEKAFETLGTFAEVQEVQLARVNNYWNTALRDAGRFGLETEMGIALCFDIAVQNGGVDFEEEETRINLWVADHPDAMEPEKRILIADVVAENSLSEYVEDVRLRKRTIAVGEGVVHGSRYATQDWGITEEPWES
jgi:hypothetical protein